jgi:hypothetical protein
MNEHDTRHAQAESRQANLRAFGFTPASQLRFDELERDRDER